jgi:hypothetical protein
MCIAGGVSWKVDKVDKVDRDDRVDEKEVDKLTS